MELASNPADYYYQPPCKKQDHANNITSKRIRNRSKRSRRSRRGTRGRRRRRRRRRGQQCGWHTSDNGRCFDFAVCFFVVSAVSALRVGSYWYLRVFLVWWSLQ